MYFRNKFNEQFLFLCNKQEPKGGRMRLDDVDHTFWVVERNTAPNQPSSVKVIPLLLYTVIESSWMEDYNVENFMMLCEDKPDTEVVCYYDKNVVGGTSKEFVCKFGVENITGDLVGD